MAKESYTLVHANASYSAYGAAAFDLKQGLAEDGITINMDEDFGERTNGADGSTLWSEYMTSSGTIDIVVMANSPVYAYFVTLQAAQRASGTKGRDTFSCTNRDFNESFTASKCAIQRISGEKIDKRGNATRTITISAGSITRVAAQG